MEPLANKIRPTSLETYIGQKHLVGEGKPLNLAIKNKHLFSFILWGPPGVGKTTLARIYAKAVNAEYHELSAVSAGKDDIRKIVEDRSSVANQSNLKDQQSFDLSAPTTSGHLPMPGEKNIEKAFPKILFLDEIHRFNKAQQDFLLPFVEKGELTLIGATTENPSFEVIPALLSRCRVFVLNELGDEEMGTIIRHAIKNLSPSAQGGGALSLKGESNIDQAISWLVNLANGDARQALTMLDNCRELYSEITLDNLKNTLQSKFLRYDKAGEEHYNTISAFIKSMRASQANAALYYLARMVEAGEDPLFIARRMVVFASEDIGLAQPTALVVANAVFEACEKIGYPECAINLAHGVSYLANCKKDRSSHDAYFMAVEDVKKFGNLPVPMQIRNAPTKLMKDLGYGKDYEKYPSRPSSPLRGENTGEGDLTNNDNDFLPEKLKGKKYLKDSN